MKRAVILLSLITALILVNDRLMVHRNSMVVPTDTSIDLAMQQKVCSQTCDNGEKSKISSCQLDCKLRYGVAFENTSYPVFGEESDHRACDYAARDAVSDCEQDNHVARYLTACEKTSKGRWFYSLHCEKR